MLSPSKPRSTWLGFFIGVHKDVRGRWCANFVEEGYRQEIWLRIDDHLPETAALAFAEAHLNELGDGE